MADEGYWLNGEFVRLGKKQSKHMGLRVVRSDGALLYENEFAWHDEASWTLLQEHLQLVGEHIAEQCLAAIHEAAGWELQISDVDGIEFPPGEWITLQRYP